MNILIWPLLMIARELQEMRIPTKVRGAWFQGVLGHQACEGDLGCLGFPRLCHQIGTCVNFLGQPHRSNTNWKPNTAES